MELTSDRGRRVTVEELNTSRLLAHARQQAHQRKFDDMLIVDVDAHHYENEHIEGHPALHGERRAAAVVHARSRHEGRPRHHDAAQQVGYQDMGGRVTRYPMRASEKTEHRQARATSSSAIAGWTR